MATVTLIKVPIPAPQQDVTFQLTSRDEEFLRKSLATLREFQPESPIAMNEEIVLRLSQGEAQALRNLLWACAHPIDAYKATVERAKLNDVSRAFRDILEPTNRY